ncbi:putative phosphoglycerate mutase GpmB [Morella rubra]|uniref:Putative phosphoglycerate mutase GpmB n=1 Tax=Morella rubra TaxID=262757 RepID=A0A6A1VVM3_9ROSI|nr:putative phosphoglycerate mutase GpmB [Morella rubra]
MRALRSVNPAHLSSRTTSQPISRPPPSFTFSGVGNALGLNGVRSLTLTPRHSTHQLRTTVSYMAQSETSVVNPTYAEIIVVRHGETEWNVDGRIQGHLDVKLNDAGRQQATAVADRLSREPKISVVYSSDLKRALETAQIIASTCGGLEIITERDLRERHLGDLQGLVLSDAAKLSPEAYKAFLNHRADHEIPIRQLETFLILFLQGEDISKLSTLLRSAASSWSLFHRYVPKYYWALGGGESLNQLYERCTSSLERIGRKHEGERVVVVTHGGVIRTLYKRACPNVRSGGKILNTSVSIFHLSDGNTWTIKSRGDVSHLNGTGFLESGFGGDKTSG